MSNFSINTNVGASIALRSLASIQTGLSRVQNQVSTGQKVAHAQDNAAVFAVAQGVRANLVQYDAVNMALSDGQSLLSVAITGATAVSNLITGITATLTKLSDESISDNQRKTYTANLKAQIDEVQTFINGATYNGIDLLSADGGTTTNAVTNGGFNYFSSANNVHVLAGLNGESVTINAQNLTGSTLGQDGFLGLSRLVYHTNVDDNFAVNNYDPANDPAEDFNNGIIANQNGSLISRSALSAHQAAAALMGTSQITDGYYVTFAHDSVGTGYHTTTATLGIYSFYTASIAKFTNQVNAALGSLGADNANIQSQITFVQSLSDAANTGLGNLVDADMAQASAQLTALQTQQQLATQALGIANAQPSNILALFGKAA